jgi:putative membrane protein
MLVRAAQERPHSRQEERPYSPAGKTRSSNPFTSSSLYFRALTAARTPMLWLKALHVIFVVTWFAGLFYLPRLFVYHVEAGAPEVKAQFEVMERRLLVITHLGGGLAVAFGIATLLWFAAHDGAYLSQGWLHLKLLLVAALIGYHAYLVRLKNQLAADRCTRSARWLRVFNEIPALLLIAIVILVVVKP